MEKIQKFDTKCSTSTLTHVFVIILMKIGEEKATKMIHAWWLHSRRCKIPWHFSDSCGILAYVT